MADQIRREDIIEEGAIKAPLEIRDNLLTIPPALTAIVDQMNVMMKTLQSATSVTKLKSEVNGLTKAQKDLNEAQKVIITSHNEVIEYEKKLAAETKKVGTVINEQEKAAAKAANAATAWGASIQQASKKQQVASKEINKGFIAEKGSLEELIQSRDRLKKFIDEEKLSQKEEAEALKEGNITRAEYNEIVNASNTRISEYTLKLKDANKDITSHIALEGRDAKAINAKNSSLKVLEAALAKNREAYAKLTNEEQRNSKEGKELLKIIQSQDKESKALSQTIGLNQKQVGSYTESIKAALSPLTQFTGGFGQAGAAMTNMTKSMGGVSKGAGLLRFALMSIPIFALIAGITSLIAYFKGTEEGAQRLRIIMAAVGQVFDSLKDVAINFGKAIYEALSDPKQLIIDIGNAIKENIMNRVYGVIDLFIALKDAGVAAFTLIKEKIKGIFGDEDTEAIEKAKSDLVDAGKRASESFIQAQTGVDNLVDKVIDGFGKAKDAVIKFYDETGKKVERSIELQKLENDLIVQKRNFLVREQELQKEINRQREIASDSLLTEQVRLEAALKQRESMEKLEKERLSIAKQELYILNERIKLSHTDEATLEKQKQLQSEVVALEAEGYANRLRNTRQIATLQNAIIEKEKKTTLDRIKLAEASAIREGKARIEEVNRFIQEEVNLINQSVLAGTKTRERAEFDIVQLRRNTNKMLIEEQLNMLSEMLKNEIDSRDQEIAAIESARDRRIEILQEQYKDQPELFASARIQIEEETQDEINKVIESSANEQQIINDETYKANVKLQEAILDVVEHRFDEEIRMMSRVQMFYEEWTNAIGNLFSALTDRKIQELDREQQAVIDQREALLDHEKEMTEIALENSELTEEQKAGIKRSSRQRQQEIEEEYAKKEEAIEQKKLKAQRKAAIYEKAQAIVSAAINTALAVMKTFATAGFPAGVPLAAAMGALGAVQIAAIAAKPIPAAKDGIENHKGGPIRVSEEGVELIKYASGKIGFTPANDSVINLERGASVIPHDKTLKFLALQGLSYNKRHDRIERTDTRVMEGELRDIKKVIKNKPAVMVNGHIIGMRKNGTRINYIQSLRNR